MDNIVYKIAEKLKKSSDTPFLDARYFVAETTDEILLNNFIARRQQGEPVAKIIGHKGFWSLELKVSSDTLDPRPDSETIIDAVLHYFPDRKQKLRILDMGTGSGCLLLALLSEYTNAEGIGIDFSKKALKIAKENGKQCKRAIFMEKDWTTKDWFKDLGTFDVVVSNPPYIPTQDIIGLDKEVRLYDPYVALDGGEDGLEAYRAIFKNISYISQPNTFFFFEIGKGQENDVINLAHQVNLEIVEQKLDLGNIIRCLVFKKKAAK